MSAVKHLLWRSNGAVETYSQKVARLMAGNEVFHYPLDEPSGTIMTNAFGTGDGTYSGAAAQAGTSPTGGFSRWFDGINDFGDPVVAGAWATAFSAAEGTLSAWGKVHDTGVWTDGTLRHLLRVQNGAAIDLLSFQKRNTNNDLRTQYSSLSLGNAETISTVSTTGWFHLATVWTDSGNYVRHLIDGVQVGSDIDRAAAWGAAPNGTKNVIGAFENTGTQSWHGWLWGMACMNRAASDAEVAKLATI